MKPGIIVGSLRRESFSRIENTNAFLRKFLTTFMEFTEGQTNA